MQICETSENVRTTHYFRQPLVTLKSDGYLTLVMGACVILLFFTFFFSVSTSTVYNQPFFLFPTPFSHYKFFFFVLVLKFKKKFKIFKKWTKKLMILIVLIMNLNQQPKFLMITLIVGFFHSIF